MEVVDIYHTFHFPHCLGHVFKLHSTGQAFQKNIARFSRDVPGSVDDEQRENNGEYRVNVCEGPYSELRGRR